MPRISTAIAAGVASLLGLCVFGSAGAGIPLPPLLVAIDTIGSDSAEFSLVPTPVESPVTGLRLKFGLPVTLQPGDLQLVAAGPDGRIDTQWCTVPAGDDQPVPLATLRHALPTNEVAAEFGADTGLAAGDYRFLLCAPWGVATGRHDFAVAETGRLANPNFSAGLQGWQPVGLTAPAAQVAHAGVDADGSAVSGAVRINGAAGTAVLLVSDTCVHGSRAPYRLRLKHRVLHGTVRVRITELAGFAGDLGETSCVGPVAQQVTATVESEPAASFGVLESARQPGHRLPAALVAIEVRGIGEEPFEVLLDDAGLSSDTKSVFVSRFE